MAYKVMACIVMAYTNLAYIAMTYMVMAYMVLAYIDMAEIVLAMQARLPASILTNLIADSFSVQPAWKTTYVPVFGSAGGGAGDGASVGGCSTHT